jgi:hypothetical protein
MTACVSAPIGNYRPAGCPLSRGTAAPISVRSGRWRIPRPRNSAVSPGTTKVSGCRRSTSPAGTTPSSRAAWTTTPRRRRWELRPSCWWLRGATSSRSVCPPARWATSISPDLFVGSGRRCGVAHLLKPVVEPPEPHVARGGGILRSPEFPAGAFDHIDTEQRQDVLVYTSHPLPAGLEVTGRVRMALFAATDSPSTDWVIRPCDVDHRACRGTSSTASFASVTSQASRRSTTSTCGPPASSFELATASGSR